MNTQIKRMVRNFLFLILWWVYFYFYNSQEYLVFAEYMKSQIKYGDIILSYITAFIWFFTSLWIIGFINKYLEKISHKYFEDKKDLIFVLDFIIKLISITKYVIAFYIFSKLADLPAYARLIANKTYSIIIIVIFLYFLSWFVNKFFQDDLIKKSKLKSVSKNLLPFVNKIIIALIWIVGAITIIWNLGYDITALVAGAWIWGLAVAFAAQKSIANVFGAITIILNKPFNIWDYIMVNWAMWVVKDIWLSYLTITDKLWHQIMIPNEVIISTNVENFSVRKNRRTDFNIWLVYGTALFEMEKWVKIIEDILEKYVSDKTISHYRVHFDMFWNFSLDITVTYFSLLNDDFMAYLKQKEDINLEIKKQFKDAKLEMAFPTQEVIIKK